MPQIPIYHMASMARSGETLVLEHLARHPDLKIVHYVKAVDKADETGTVPRLTLSQT